LAIFHNKPTVRVFVDGGAHGRGSNGKSAPMDGGYLPHGTNIPYVGSRIQEVHRQAGRIDPIGTRGTHRVIALQKPKNLIPLKKPEMQGAKFSRNEEGESRFAPTAYAAVTGKLKQRRRSGFF